jgi:hypothetical protein
MDLDMANSFHQFLLGPITSSRLSIQTPWGQYQPKYMPEGVSPASLELQRVMSEVFSDCSEFMIVIFDNLLLLAHDLDDAYTKLEGILDRCIKRNVVLKFPKTSLGFPTVQFFGYQFSHNDYKLTPQRTQGITSMPRPATKRAL